MTDFTAPLLILIVNDNLGDQLLIKKHLGRARGGSLLGETAATLAGALERLAAKRYDAVLLDLSLPDSKGIATLKKLRERHPTVPVIVLMGLDDESAGVEAMQAGAQDYLVKDETTAGTLARAIHHGLERMRAERELQLSRERLEAAQRQAKLGSFEVDLQSGRVEWSDELYRLHGLEPRSVEPSFENFLALVHPADRASVVASSQEVRQGSQGVSFQVRICRPDGAMRVHLCRLDRAVGPAGEGTLLRGSVFDITDLKRAEETAEVSERQYRVLFDAHPSAMWVYDLDAKRLLTVNQAALEQYGYTREEFLSSPLGFLRRPESREALMEAFDAKRPQDVDGLRRHVRKDGTELDVEVSLHPITLRGASVVLVKARDVTAELEAKRRALASEAKYGRLFNSVADAVLVVDPAAGLIVDCNEVAVAAYGYARQELVGLPSQALSAMPPDEHQKMRRLIAAGERVLLRDRLHRRKDGSTFIAEMHCSAFDEAGRRLFLASIRDVTERNEAQERFRRMAESIDQVFWMTDIEKKSMIYVSTAYEKIWGRTCGSLMENPLNWLAAIVPEDRERVAKAAFEKQLLGQYDETYRIARPDGSVRWIRDRAFPIKDADGCVRQVSGIAEDVTEQRRAAQALMLGEAWLETAQDVAQMGSWVSPVVEDKPLVWSRGCYRIFGLPVSKPITVADFFAMVHPADRERVRAASLRSLETGAEYETEHRIIRPDGEVRWVLEKARVACDAAGKAESLIGIVQDVTDRVLGSERLKAAELQLRQALKMEAVGRLAGGVAHDFNNLLTAILGMAELSLAELPKSHPVAKDLADIRDTALRAADLTQQLLAFSRRQFVEPRVLDLNASIEGLSKMLRRLIGEHIDLRVTAAPAGAVVRADPGQMEQLIVNLAVNGRDAMAAGGTLSVTTSVESFSAAQAEALALVVPGRYVALTVADTGSGMDEEVKSHLFEPFFTTKPQGKGTGLGLATCYGIVKQAGGAIVCETAPGQGTKFRIYLPAVKAAPVLVARPDAGRVTGGQETVLVVEDEAPVRRLMLRVLSEQGYKTLEAADGEEGLKIVRADTQKRLSLIVSDAVMPRMSGKKLADAVAKERPEMRMLLVSGYTDDIILREGIESSSIPFLRKPFTPQALAAKVRGVLDGAGRPLKPKLSAPKAPGKGA